MSTFQELKLAIVAATGLSRDALHIYFGLAVLIAAALALRRPLRSLAPWAVALAAAVMLELLDLRDDLRSAGRWHWVASAHDVVNTMVWPTVLLFAARLGALDGRRNAGDGPVK